MDLIFIADLGHLWTILSFSIAKDIFQTLVLIICLYDWDFCKYSTSVKSHSYWMLMFITVHFYFTVHFIIWKSIYCKGKKNETKSICFNTDLSNLSKVWSMTHQSLSLHMAFLSDLNPWIDTYIYANIDTVKIFLLSHHMCKRTPPCQD